MVTTDNTQTATAKNVPIKYKIANLKLIKGNKHSGNVFTDVMSALFAVE